LLNVSLVCLAATLTPIYLTLVLPDLRLENLFTVGQALETGLEYLNLSLVRVGTLTQDNKMSMGLADAGLASSGLFP
jgi:hypothetical protein